MSAEQLRRSIVDEQRSACKEEPGVHAVANFLATFQWWIFEAAEPADQQEVLNIYGYQDIKSLRRDAAELIVKLHGELGHGNWENYFSRRGDLLDSNEIDIPL